MYMRANFRVFSIRVLVRVRVFVVHTPQSILVLSWHGFTAQKWPHIAKVMPFL